MAIKPVDFQVMIPRTMEAAKVSNDEMQRNHAMQQQKAAATQHRAEDSLKTVYARSQAQDARISEKQREKGQKDRKQRKNEKSAEAEEDREKKNLNNSIRTSTIDIKI